MLRSVLQAYRNNAQRAPSQSNPSGSSCSGSVASDSSSSGGSASTDSKMVSPITPRASILPERKFAHGGGFGVIEVKPFKPPMKRSSDVSMHGRKRKRVDYAGMGGEADNSADGNAGANDSDDDDDVPTAKKAKGSSKNKAKLDFSSFKGVSATGASLIKVIRPKLDVKPKDGKVQLKRVFTLPTRRDTEGNIIEQQASRPALGCRIATEVPPRPLHDPVGAIVLYDPTVDDPEVQREKERIHQAQEEAEARLTQQSADAGNDAEDAKKKSLPDPSIHKSLAEILGIRRKDPNEAPPKVPVVIDPKLAAILRPHQVEGVRFMYRCATGLVKEDAFGSIMADGMGLGKTLQCIALMWTLLKQSPIPRQSTIEKCIIACPSTLVRNWANEMKKWLGDRAPGLLVMDGSDKTKDAMIESVRRWCATRGRNVTKPVMIVSYETLRTITSTLADTEVGLLLCDEGHRLKNAESLTYKELAAINVKRRVIMSGTPIQNDLTEYFALMSFANPLLLGNRQEFHKNFELPILRGRDSDSTEKEQEKGDAKLKELLDLVSKFIIRRSNELNTKYLPIKYEHVVFCNLAPFQKSLYRHFVTSKEIRRLIKGKGSQPLKAIGVLKKLCNHPDLVDLKEDMEGSEELWPAGYKPGMSFRSIDSSLSGKMEVVERFLQKIRHTSKDKVVLISNYTQTLDMFQRMAHKNHWGAFRLDGTMAIKKRANMVDQFNDPERNEFLFLLSSKAGGCGINLIGANRLILFDPDWNPAADQQALARVWREGQKKDCYVYRFISTGTIEEKIFQRQMNKQALSKCVVDEAEGQERQFATNELRELFTFREDAICDTHDTIKCKRCKNGVQHTKAPAMLNEDTSTWNHYSREEFGQLHDDLLRAEVTNENVSFVFQFCSV